MVRVDHGAFEDWAGSRLSPLVRFGFALTHDEGGAEDLVESALVHTLRAWPELRGDGDPDAYARRMMVAEQESRWRRPRGRPEPPAVRDDLGFAEVAPEEVELVERDRVWRELVDLPPRQRAVLVLRYYEGRSGRDVAAILGCPVAAVTSETREAIGATRVHDAIAANVDLMPGPPRIVERALASAEREQQQRRRARLVVVGLAAATAVAGAVGIALASGWRPAS